MIIGEFTMNAKEYLNRYRHINNYIDCKLEEVAKLRALATRLSPTARFDSSGNVSDRVGRSVAKIVDLTIESVDVILSAQRAEGSSFRFFFHTHFVGRSVPMGRAKNTVNSFGQNG